MSELKKNEPLPKTPDPGASAANNVDPSEDALADNGAITDEAPTIITKNRQPPPPEPAPNDIRGRRLAHFELIEQIGAGGMAAVLRARDTQLDRFVALKILPPDLAQDQENVKRFHQEARAAAKLDHENIARVFFCGEDQKLHFIAFEFVEGENLRTILDRRGRLPVAEALPYMIQIAAGLGHAAERGVVHRDIKPSNIIITPHGRAKLVDMGLARSMEPQHDQGLTQSGVTLGTFDYISPEQALEPRDADVRSDIYSLGCTFYHMITGRPPVPEGTPARKLHHHQNVKPLDPREVVSNLPDEIVLILARMMAKNQNDRYQTAQELLRHLLGAARKLGTSADVPEGVLMVEAEVPTPPGSVRPFLLGGLAIAAVVVLVFCLDMVGPSTPPLHPRPEPSNPDGSSTKPNPPLPVTEKKGTQTPTNPLSAPDERTVTFNRDIADLPTWLQDPENKNAAHVVIKWSGTLDREILGEFTDPGLLIQARQSVVIEPREAGAAPTIRLTYNGAERLKHWAALTIQSPKSRIEGLRVEISAAASRAPMTGIYFKGGKHVVTDCTILQALPDPDQDRQMAGVRIEADPGTACSLDLIGSVFVGYGTRDDASSRWLLGKAASRGQEAVVRKGPVELLARNCAFGPHGSLFQLEKGDSGKPTGQAGPLHGAAQRPLGGV